MYATFDNLTLSIAGQNYQEAMPKVPVLRRCTERWEFFLKTCCCSFCINDFTRNSGVYFIYCHKQN